MCSSDLSAASATSPAAQPRTDSDPARSAGVGGSDASSDPVTQTLGSGSEPAADQVAQTEATGSGAAEEVPATNGLLDGLKIVAQNGEAKDRAERLAVGQAPVVFDTADSPACTDCGSIMVRNGSCYKCINCGATSGCS